MLFSHSKMVQHYCSIFQFLPHFSTFHVFFISMPWFIWKFSMHAHIFNFLVCSCMSYLLACREQISYNRSYWAFVGFIIIIFWLDKITSKKGEWKHSPVCTTTGSQQKSDSDIMLVIRSSQNPGQSEVSPWVPADFPSSLGTSGTGPPPSPVTRLKVTNPGIGLLLKFPKVNLLFSNS